MAKIDPKKLKEIFTEDILDILPSNRDINRGVANKVKANDPTIIAKITKASKTTWADPNHREKMEKVHADRSQSEWYDKIAEANKWGNKSEEAKQNILKSRKELPNNPNYIEGMQRRKNSDWHIKNAIAHKDKNKNPKNIRVCEYCQKQTTANTHERHIKSCLFKNGPITTYKGNDPQYTYTTEQALVNDGFDLMRIKQILGTEKMHAGYLFKIFEPR